jgi:hypothetical protein
LGRSFDQDHLPTASEFGKLLSQHFTAGEDNQQSTVDALFQSVELLRTYYILHQAWKFECDYIRKEYLSQPDDDLKETLRDLEKYKRFQECKSFDEYKEIYMQGSRAKK